MRRRAILLDLAFVLLLVGLPLISFGATRDETVVWIIGFVVLAAGFVLPLALRFVPAHQPPEDEPDVFEEPS
jgi:hydrogenase-4 membrane subunit HyfE